MNEISSHYSGKVNEHQDMLGKGFKWKNTQLGKNLPGIIMVFIIAYIAMVVGKEFPLIGSTVIAILLGVLH